MTNDLGLNSGYLNTMQILKDNAHNAMQTAVSPQCLHQVEVSKLMKLHKRLQNLNVEVISKNKEKKVFNHQ